ncbi:hypothetical protein Tco_1389730, partial [Tanacetum coccineum]
GMRAMNEELHPLEKELCSKNHSTASQNSEPTVSQNLRKNSNENSSGPGDLFSPQPHTALRTSSLEIGLSKVAI